jgi:lipid-A-disaccharide synthase
MSSDRRIILFTAMEPSGDAHAAPVIEEIKRNHPDLEPVAWGGPLMEAAGATMLGRTADDGVMGLAGIGRIREVKRLHDEIVEWASARRVAVHMPVDSPSANMPLAARLKPLGARIVNLVAPQLWAWAPWRIGKVRATSEVLLCLLPFEEQWFRSRGVRAKFIGHPVMSRELDKPRIAEERASLPPGGPRIVLLPGSRSGEVKANATLLTDVFSQIQNRHRAAVGVVVASSDANARLFRDRVGGRLPPALHTMVGGLDGALDWGEMALAVSGTVSLDCTRHAKPVIGVYKTSWLEWLGAKIVIRAPHLLLPNIIAGREIVPEFVPYAGGPGRIAETALDLIGDGRRMARMREDLQALSARFEGRDPAKIAAEVLSRAAAGKGLTNAELDSIK